jgi:RND family efflux transporter MFP subunit
MNTENQSENNTPSLRPLKKSSSRVIFAWIVPVLIVVLAIAFAKYQIATRPKARRQKPPQQARLVTVETAEKTNHKTVVSAMGPVIPAQEITLAPEVSGRVTFVDPLVIPGGAVQQGQVLIKIDSRDYEAVVKQRQSELAQAELNLKLEQGNQLVAQQEYKLLDDIVQQQDEELVLRKPHLEETRAALESAKAQLATAQLDVERCTVKAPFNAVIQEKLVDVGAQVTPSSSLLTIMGTDEYWVQAKVNVDQLHWINIPDGDGQQGSSVKIFDGAAWGPDIWREGRVLRLLGQLEEQGRLAQVLVSVKDPLSLSSDSSKFPPILVGSYVRIKIDGKTIEDVFSVRRDYLHDGDNIWVMNKNDQLEIRPVEVLFREKDTVYLSNGLQDGDRIVTTDISAPVDGMLLRLNHEANEKPETQK